MPSEMVELSAAARNGDSGGPILNSRGELAGVLFGTAFGRTTGSYCGRLRWFLASVEGDFRSLSNRVMLADQSRRAGTPVAAIPTGLASASAAGTGNRRQPIRPATHRHRTPRRRRFRRCRSIHVALVSGSFRNQQSTAGADRSVDAGRVCSVPGPVAAAPPAGPTSTSDQIKTILALIGVVAVLYHAMRLLGSAVG